MQFSIRDILWLTVVVAIAVGWWLTMPKSMGTARVTGSVMVAGKPLSQGHVLFHSPDGPILGAKVAAGKYIVPAMPTGSYAITVDGSGVATRYASAATTALRVEVREGTSTFDFALQ
jgi:hypothetical protein